MEEKNRFKEGDIVCIRRMYITQRKEQIDFGSFFEVKATRRVGKDYAYVIELKHNTNEKFQDIKPWNKKSGDSFRILMEESSLEWPDVLLKEYTARVSKLIATLCDQIEKYGIQEHE